VLDHLTMTGSVFLDSTHLMSCLMGRNMLYKCYLDEHYDSWRCDALRFCRQMPLAFLHIWKDSISHWLLFTAPAPVSRLHANSPLPLRCNQQISLKTNPVERRKTIQSSHLPQWESQICNTFRRPAWFRGRSSNYLNIICTGCGNILSVWRVIYSVP
jgi:hypothetical protein